MAGRRSVWSDPRIIERARAFVPATDEVWRLQRGLGPESRAFQDMANAGHYRGKGGSRQGIYICTPAGRLLGSANSLNADRVVELLDKGLARWNELDEEQRAETLLNGTEELTSDPRWEWSYPEEGLVLRSINRDLPADGRPESAPPHERYNVDHAWFSAEEALGFVPGEPEPGAWFDVDSTVVIRLARFHLVDNVRGQTLPFATEEIEAASLRGVVESVEGEVVRMRFEGATRAVTDGRWRMGENDWTPNREWPRSVECRLLGGAEWNTRTRRFEGFTLVGLAERDGVTGLNGRRDDREGRLGFFFTLAGDDPADRIAPAFVDVYDASWIDVID